MMIEIKDYSLKDTKIICQNCLTVQNSLKQIHIFGKASHCLYLCKDCFKILSNKIKEEGLVE